MRLDNQRESSNFEDRGRGSGGGRGGVGGTALFAIFRLLGFRGVLIAAVLFGAVYLFNPFGLRDSLLGGAGQSSSVASGAGACAASPDAEQACRFSRQILASTEDVWTQQFTQGRLPSYGQQPGAYTDPKLVVFADSVNTACGGATASVGPFYCPGDGNLYIDPSFYQVMAQRLQAPGYFAQAYVIAHEVGHHVQKLIGATNQRVGNESENQTSVRVELQADCFAGVWGHTAQASLSIDDADLREALNAAHQIGDDTLQQNAQGRVAPDEFTHGTSAQRMRWFRRGFDSGDARQCDTWVVQDYAQL